MAIRAGENSFQKQFLKKYEDETSEENLLLVKKKSADDAKQPEPRKLEKLQKLRKMVTDRSDFSTEALVQKLKEQTLKNLKNSIRQMHAELKEEKIQEAHKLDKELQDEYETMTDSEKALKDAVDQIFESYDTNKDGMLNIKEFTKWLNDVQDSEIDHEVVQINFDNIDTNTNNFISKKELFQFLKLMD